jgi:hypothetical protein
MGRCLNKQESPRLLPGEGGKCARCGESPVDHDKGIYCGTAPKESPRAEGPYKREIKEHAIFIKGPDLMVRLEKMAWDEAGQYSHALNRAFAQGQSSDRYRKMWEALWFGLETDWHDTYSKDWLIRRKKELEERQ